MPTAQQVTPADTRFTLDSLHEIGHITRDLAETLQRLASEKVAAEGRIRVTASDILDIAPAVLAEAARRIGQESEQE